MPLIKEVLDALRIPTLEREGFEADDIIATLAGQASAAGMSVLVCSGDRDSIQLVDDDVTLLYPLRGVSELTRFTPDAVEAKYGVPPAQYPDVAALVGETSDNLPRRARGGSQDGGEVGGPVRRARTPARVGRGAEGQGGSEPARRRRPGAPQP